MNAPNVAPVPAPRTRLRRHPERGAHDRATVHAIVDEALVAHVAIAGPDGPVGIPMAFVRVGDEIVLHGARASRLMQQLSGGAPVCVTVTLTDGLVIARSAFRCSMNYRSVVAFGRAREVDDPGEKRRVLELLVARLTLGAGESLRSPSDEELAATAVVAVALSEASAKTRTGPPRDLEADVARGGWAGEIPIRQSYAPPRRAPDAPWDAAPPAVLGGVHEERVGDVLLSTDPNRVDVDVVHTFLSTESYWARGIDRPRVERAIAGSVVVGAYVEGRQVGFARLVTDGATFGWIADVFVLPSHRRRGLAGRMVAILRDRPELTGARRLMLGTRDAHAVYAPLGFRPFAAPERFMEIVRDYASS